MSARINAYRTPPQAERKAAAELREQGIRAYVPTEKRNNRRVPVAPGYVFAGTKPFDSKHVRENIGACARIEVRRLYQRSTAAPQTAAYAPGDSIEITVGHATTIPATVVERVDGHANWYWVESELIGKTFRTKVHLPPRPP